VLERVCPECGIDGSSFAREKLGTRVRANAGQWVELLDDNTDAIRIRPSPTSWSPLEYACHVRDVLDLYLIRLNLMLEEDGPHYPNWNQDETAITKRYDLADPRSVSVELAASADAMANAFDSLDARQWSRPGYRSDGATFTVESLGRYLLHDLEHHIWDLQRS
jgi:hypothetical protein